MVSRFLASSVCSKVPVKAKAHVFFAKQEEAGQSIPGGGVGGAPPPGNGYAVAKYPTTPHSATSNPFPVPLRLYPDVLAVENRLICREFLGGAISCVATRWAQDSVQARDLQAVLRFRGGPGAAGGAGWEESGSPRRVSPRGPG